jgi:Trypsin-like peptidase domain
MDPRVAAGTAAVTLAGAIAALAAAGCGQLQTSEAVLDTQCGGTLDFTEINSYQGDLASAQQREDAVALIAGNCTGTLIAAAAGPAVLTAGHCVGLGNTVLVAFNVEAGVDGDPLVTEGVVIEQSDDPDYALIRLRDLPAVTPTLLTTRTSDLLAIIQHPRGRPKVIAEGAYLIGCKGEIFYTDLDTLVGSSGAGVLNVEGHLLGVHTDGDCAVDGSGTNFGATAERIVQVSAHLADADIADR